MCVCVCVCNCVNQSCVNSGEEENTFISGISFPVIFFVHFLAYGS